MPFFLLAAMGLAGCANREEPIRSYTVSSLKHRTMGAMLRQNDAAWFFKLTGPIKSVNEISKSFDDFLASVKFAKPSDPPDWKLPEHWVQEPGDTMRFATLKIDSVNPPLEVSVTKLPLAATSGDWTNYQLMNVNRWRKQLQLPPLDPKELVAETKPLDVAGLLGTVVDFVGTPGPTPKKGSMGPMMGGATGPMMGGADGMEGHPPMGPAAATPPARPAADLPFTYDLPADWKSVPSRQFVLASFEAQDAEQKVLITISSAGGDLLQNINRWRGQVQLEPTTAEQLKQDLQELPIGTQKGKYIRLVGAEKALFGVVLQTAEATWFFKLMGDGGLAERERPRFEAFVTSVKFNEGAR